MRESPAKCVRVGRSELSSHRIRCGLVAGLAFSTSPYMSRTQTHHDVYRLQYKHYTVVEFILKAINTYVMVGLGMRLRCGLSRFINFGDVCVVRM